MKSDFLSTGSFNELWARLWESYVSRCFAAVGYHDFFFNFQVLISLGWTEIFSLVLFFFLPDACFSWGIWDHAKRYARLLFLFSFFFLVENAAFLFSFLVCMFAQFLGDLAMPVLNLRTLLRVVVWQMYECIWSHTLISGINVIVLSLTSCVEDYLGVLMWVN